MCTLHDGCRTWASGRGEQSAGEINVWIPPCYSFFGGSRHYRLRKFHPGDLAAPDLPVQACEPFHPRK
ncbi:hypothetical protein EVAR_38510_1 [Eumeta japonica]|uniref:Uncharacterized protein n=1 Tax=Eumeta variegata TaxID=151549 RepID=A0A4C1WAX4_EUMVA|nr:hypothetical protein EVAR_38510_1 [Eumeta japonica]